MAKTATYRPSRDGKKSAFWCLAVKFEFVPCMNCLQQWQFMADPSCSILVPLTLLLEHTLSTSAATSVTIGLQETSYSVYETDEYQVVCAEVLSGDIAGRSINIIYITESDTAEGSVASFT